MRALVSLVALVLTGSLSSACDAPKSPAPRSAGAPASAPARAESKTGSLQATPTTAPVRRTGEPPKAIKSVPTDPKLLATQLCSAALKTPAVLGARCCKRRPERVDLSTCIGALEAGFRTKRLSAKGTARCFFDLEEALDGCDWVGGMPPVPLSCRGVVESLQKEGQPCAHNVDCVTGVCTDKTCRVRTNPDTCTSVAGMFVKSACPAADNCIDGACVPACSPPCHANEQCAAGSCVALKAPGQPCTTASDCVGGCLEGLCAMRCEEMGTPRK